MSADYLWYVFDIKFLSFWETAEIKLVQVRKLLVPCIWSDKNTQQAGSSIELSLFPCNWGHLTFCLVDEKATLLSIG